MSIELHDDMVPVLDAKSAARAMQTYQDICRAMLDASDYQTIGSKQFKKRSAYRKLARAFGISDEIVEENREVIDGNIVYRVKVRAFTPHRSCIGVAICSSAEGAKRSSGHMEHDIYSTAHTRAKNRAIADLIGSGEVSAEEMQTAGTNTPAATGGGGGDTITAFVPKSEAERLALEKARNLGKQLTGGGGTAQK